MNFIDILVSRFTLHHQIYIETPKDATTCEIGSKISLRIHPREQQVIDTVQRNTGTPVHISISHK